MRAPLIELVHDPAENLDGNAVRIGRWDPEVFGHVPRDACECMRGTIITLHISALHGKYVISPHKGIPRTRKGGDVLGTI